MYSCSVAMLIHDCSYLVEGFQEIYEVMEDVLLVLEIIPHKMRMSSVICSVVFIHTLTPDCSSVTDGISTTKSIIYPQLVKILK